MQGNCLDVLEDLPAEVYDSLVTDPPAGIAFMGKNWDEDKGGRDAWVKWMASVMKECLRVLKPGAHGFVWALPRTSHWTATALEDAGFEIRDIVTHVFGSGFPKSHNISKGIDKAAGAKKVVGTHVQSKQTRKPGNSLEGSKDASLAWEYDLTAPATNAAKQWDGWGTALKPACEHWVLVRKPLSEKTVAKNVLRHGTGGINIDASRIELDGTENMNAVQDGNIYGSKGIYGKADQKEVTSTYKAGGRFPANFLCSGEARELLDEQSGVLKSGAHLARHKNSTPTGNGKTHGEMAGIATDRLGASQGGASRFFYCAKSSKAERNAGCEGMAKSMKYAFQTGNGASGKPSSIELTKSPNRKPTANNHPTVKAQKLMRYLCKMITPPGGTVLDPFTGSGSTGVAAIAEGFKFMGIEQEKEYVGIARARLEYAKNKETRCQTLHKL